MNSGKRRYVSQTRAAQAAATRERIRAAAAGLHAERLWDDFTLQEVAARAGVSVQTVLRSFGSRQALITLASEASLARVRPASPPGDIAAAVHAVFDDYDAIGDRVIRFLAEAPRSSELMAMADLGRRGHRAWVEAAFAPQLASCPADQRTRLLHALIVATDVYVWQLLYRDLRLPRAEAEQIVSDLIVSRVQGGTDGEVSVGVLGRRRQPAAQPGDCTGADGARP